MSCAPGSSVIRTATAEASAALSRRTSAGAPSAMTMAAGWTANRLPSMPKSSASSKAARCAISWLPRTWIRFGWMRLRWPTRAAPSVLSRRRGVVPPALPLIQASPSFSRLSSYSCATLICNMRLPGSDLLMNRARVGIFRESCAQLAVAQHLSKLGEYAQMLFGRLLGHEEKEHQAYGFSVGCVERHRLGKAHEGAHGFLQSLDPAVRNGDSLPQPPGPEALPGEQTVERQAPRDALVVLDQQAGLLEHALLAGHIQVEKDVRRRQKLRY